jgi:hypothetical protein
VRWVERRWIGVWLRTGKISVANKQEVLGLSDLGTYNEKAGQ